jgi:hypothetical protein
MIKDYIIFWGESTLDHRIAIANLRPGYNISFTNCKYWNGLNPDNNYQSGTDSIWGVTTGYTYDTYLMKMIADTLGVTARYIKRAKGGSAVVGPTSEPSNGCWNTSLYGDHYSNIKSHILNVREIERMRGNTARFRLVISDIKGNDAFYGYTSQYAYMDGSTLKGEYINFHNKLKELTLNPNLSLIDFQLLFKQTSLGTVQQRNDMLTAQDLIKNNYPNTYMLAMNDIDIATSGTRYTMQVDQHLDDNGDYNKALDVLDIIISNNLLTDWQ